MSNTKGSPPAGRGPGKGSPESDDHDWDEIERLLSDFLRSPDRPDGPRRRTGGSCGYMRVAGPGAGFECPICGLAGD